ncbi:hypothetical protein OE88DRAFT_1364598 [Heliocybe sulcata]|uniref:Uncharacterized protein n=1 Tax=Heliocybe sulcata TaxID=5364 RepID=A0A5C3N4U3_9AGAM|nr:hypothetical protein OE88DRAFT_1364598 [Heliocybe sulcata]
MIMPNPPRRVRPPSSLKYICPPIREGRSTSRLCAMLLLMKRPRRSQLIEISFIISYGTVFWLRNLQRGYLLVVKLTSK